jgi:glycine C-acetyltransferase
MLRHALHRGAHLGVRGMASTTLSSICNAALQEMKDAGTHKTERVITSRQGPHVSVASAAAPVLNLCANNYLGLSSHPEVVAAAHRALDSHGFGTSSVRFICGTQDIHKALEARIAAFLGTEDTILYSSCFDANGGLFETLLGEEDAVISDALNHAPIIDGIRLCKAQRFRYRNNDMTDLRAQLEAAKGARFKLIATDGVFSMDGVLANMSAICDLADEYDALVMMDDSHAVGFVGERGRGTHEHCGVMGRVDIITGTLGKALGGASGGYTSGRAEVIEWLRQRSRPYLFSNSLAPVIASTSLAVLDLLERGDALRAQLRENQSYFRQAMTSLGFTLGGAGHAIIPVMLGDARLARDMADALLEEGVYVIGFSFPVVPQGQARIRTQISAGHTRADLELAVAAFEKVGRALRVIP